MDGMRDFSYLLLYLDLCIKIGIGEIGIGIWFELEFREQWIYRSVFIFCIVLY